MGLLKRSRRRRRRFRRLFMLGGLFGGIAAVRNRALARHERRNPELLQPPGHQHPSSRRAERA